MPDIWKKLANYDLQQIKKERKIKLVYYIAIFLWAAWVVLDVL